MVSWVPWAALTWSAVARCVASLKFGTSLPNAAISFYWPEPFQHKKKDCDPEHYWETLFRHVSDHPWRVASEDNATMSMKCMDWDEEAYLALPRRRKGQFYLLWQATPQPYSQWSEAIRSRADFVFTAYDRREGVGNFARPIPGVTTAPVSRIFKEYDPAMPPEYFLTFRGTMNGGQQSVDKRTREQVADDFRQYAGEGVVVEFPPRPDPDRVNRYKQLLNSAYVLVPSGHGRWSYRLSEVVMACAIPVILAPGLTMPYEDLIDWQSFAVFAGSALGSNETGDAFVALQDPEKLLRLLPRDPAVIARRRQTACDIGHTYLSTHYNRLEALLQSAAVHAGLLEATAAKDARMPPCVVGGLRFVPKKLRGASDVTSANIIRIEFMYDGKLVDTQQANVTSDKGVLVVKWGDNVKLHYFRFYTASGHDELDPIQWEVLGAAHSGVSTQEWKLHQDANGTGTPIARNSPTRWFRLVRDERPR